MRPSRRILLALLTLPLLSVSIHASAVPAFADAPAKAEPHLVTEVRDPISNDEWVEKCLDLSIDQKILGVKIVKYRIQWFGGGWSDWYTPGNGDTYQKDGEPKRRQWACFNDHTFEIVFEPVKPDGGKLLTAVCDPLQSDEWVAKCLDLDLDRKMFNIKIIKYRIKWFGGGWSGWFVPGDGDLYKKDGEPQRRQWACFNDHTYEIVFTQCPPAPAAPPAK